MGHNILRSIVLLKHSIVRLTVSIMTPICFKVCVSFQLAVAVAVAGIEPGQVWMSPPSTPTTQGQTRDTEILQRIVNSMNHTSIAELAELLIKLLKLSNLGGATELLSSPEERKSLRPSLVSLDEVVPIADDPAVIAEADRQKQIESLNKAMSG